MAEGYQRRLSAILCADIQGYSRLMGGDEERALAAVDESLGLFRQLIGEHGGRVVHQAGDGLLTEFPSVVNAVKCAVALQHQLAPRNAALPSDRRIEFRIGINLGDVMAKDGDVFGDSVNIAARLESIAEAGGISVSRAVYDAVQGRLPLSFAAQGPITLKNISQPVEVFRVATGKGGVLGRRAEPVAARSLPSKPSLVVLPFTNLSGDATQEYLSDGMTEDITSNMSRFRELFVIARASAFAYKGRDRNLKEIARDLGIRYVVEGSVRRAGERMRVNTLLVDAVAGNELWSDRYDRDFKDIFALQDEVAQTIAANLKVRIEATERQNALRSDPASLAAYGCLLRGHELFYLYTKPGNTGARRLYKKSWGIDPMFARACSALSKTHNIDWRYSWSRSPAGSLDLALELAQTAVALDEMDARGHAELGFALLYRREVDLSLAEYGRALTLNPNDADVIAEMADAMIYDGRPAEALPHFEQAMRLNPYHPDWYFWYYGAAKFQLHHYEEAIGTFQRMRNPAQARRLLAASHGHLGHAEQAQRYARDLLDAHPDFTIDRWAITQPFKHRADLDHFVEGLKKAGLP